MAGIGYTIPIRKMALSFEAEFEYSNHKMVQLTEKARRAIKVDKLVVTLFYHSNLNKKTFFSK